MSLRAFARLRATLVALAPLLGFASGASAFPRLQIHPVELVGYAGTALKLSVDLPCGGAFYGLVTSATKKGTLEVAAAVAQENIVCTSMPRPTEVVIDYLATTGFKVIAPMLVDMAQNRLLVAKIQDLKVVAGGGTKRAKLSAVYESRCGRTVGTLIRQTGKSQLEVAIVEKPEGMPMAACSARPKTRTITALDLIPQRKVEAMRDKPTSLSRTFELRLAAVQDGSVRLTPNGGVSLAYRRACNEAPVGIVVGAPKAMDGRDAVAVGVLVARYLNFPCAKAGAKTTVAELSEPGLALPENADLVLLEASKDGLELHTPLKLVRRGNELRISHADTCGLESFAVYGRDNRGAFSVGVLTRQPSDLLNLSGSPETGARSCKKGPGEVSLSQPFVAPSVMPGELAAMRLKGSSSR